MSTRCQVEVTDGDHKITLYHHTDGYPSYMLPLIKSAWKKYGKGWEGARVYKVASMLCAVDPTIFEPLPYHDLHADIEYFYSINCKGKMDMSSEPVWNVTSYEADFDFEQVKTRKQRLHKLDSVAVNKITEEYAESVKPLTSEEVPL